MAQLLQLREKERGLGRVTFLARPDKLDFFCFARAFRFFHSVLPNSLTSGTSYMKQEKKNTKGTDSEGNYDTSTPIPFTMFMINDKTAPLPGGGFVYKV